MTKSRAARRAASKAKNPAKAPAQAPPAQAAEEPTQNGEELTFVNQDECIYELFGISKTATLEEIKQQYRKLALKYHPDRHSSKPPGVIEEAKKKFQQICYIFSILSDSQKRQRYDRTGSLEKLDVDDAFEYFDQIYRSSLTVEMIEEFKKTYQGSEEEKRDLFHSYLEHEGDMDAIMTEIPCSEVSDEARFRAALTAAIEAGELTGFRAFTHEPKSKAQARKRRAEAEAQEATELAAELGIKVGTEDQLKQMIRSKRAKREQGLDQFLDHLAEKYAPPKKSKPASSTSSTKDTSSQPKAKAASSASSASTTKEISTQPKPKAKVPEKAKPTKEPRDVSAPGSKTHPSQPKVDVKKSRPARPKKGAQVAPAISTKTKVPQPKMVVKVAETTKAKKGHPTPSAAPAKANPPKAKTGSKVPEKTKANKASKSNGTKKVSERKKVIKKPVVKK